MMSFVVSLLSLIFPWNTSLIKLEADGYPSNLENVRNSLSLAVVEDASRK